MNGKDLIELSAVSPDGRVETVNCSYVSLPCEQGSLGVLANHAPMLCALAEGKVLCRNSSGEETVIEVSGGVAQVFKNNITILLS